MSDNLLRLAHLGHLATCLTPVRCPLSLPPNPGRTRMDDRLSRWRDIQNRIAHCGECCEKWPKDVTNPLSTSEIPDPPKVVNILFIGVAPTRQEGQNKGTHFYSSPQDSLRRGLFRLLVEKPFSLPLDGLQWKDGIRVFHGAKCFFVHAAKIRPILRDAPPRAAIAFCAKRHLLDEIQVIRPKAVCIIGKTKVGPVTARIFGTPLSEEPRTITVGTRTGLTAIAPQPVRGRARQTKAILSKLWLHCSV
jgi:uracil-DNA glycosylase